MLLIDISGITQHKAKISSTFENGDIFNLTIFYDLRTKSWYFDIEVPSRSFILKGQRITHSRNILRQWANVVKSGIVFRPTMEDRGVWFDADFSLDFFRMFIMNESEVQSGLY